MQEQKAFVERVDRILRWLRVLRSDLHPINAPPREYRSRFVTRECTVD